MSNDTATAERDAVRTATFEIHRPESGEVPPVTSMHANRRMTIQGDTVNKATEDLPADQRAAIRWLHTHGWDSNLSLEELGKLIRYDGTTVYRVFKGTYEGNLANVVRSIIEFRELLEKRQAGRALPFIPTSAYTRFEQAADIARENQQVVFVYGESQIGKTTAAREYQRTHNHGNTILVRMPTGGGLHQFLYSLAGALRIGTNFPQIQLRNRIIEAFDDRMLLIVDEAHQSMIGARGAKGHPLEFVREIRDTAECGVVLIGTNVFRDEINGGIHSKLFRQLRLRRCLTLQYEDRPKASDLKKFAAQYALGEHTKESAALERQIIERDGLGYWLTVLRNAAKFCKAKKTGMTWSAVVKTYGMLSALETGTTDED